MKKVFVFCLCLCTLMITGCGCNKKMKKITCTSDLVRDDYEFNSKYVLKYEGKSKLISYERTEEYESENDDLLTGTSESKKNAFEKLVELDYFDFETKINGNKLKTNLKINFDSINKGKLFELNPPYRNYYDESTKQFDVYKVVDDLEESGLVCSD